MKVYLRTFGCRANQYDTEAVRALATGAGCEIVGDAAAADVAVFNSCTVTAAAERDLRHEVRSAARANAGLRTVIMGCAAALSPARGMRGSLHDLPSVHALVPAGTAPAVAAAIGLEVAGRAAPARQSGTRGLLRIQDGCEEHCTFCATTLARGASRSRPARELADEASRLAEHHAEIVLTGTHIGSWGAESGSSLVTLVEMLVRDVPGVRLRLSSLEATEVDDRLRELLRGMPDRLAPHLHAPLQSGSDAVLRRMGRHWYDASRYAHAVERLVDGLDVFALGADVIAGFPGESDADHAATLGLIDALPFTYLHVFPYSARAGTAAVRLRGEIPGATLRRRAADLRAAGAARVEAYARRRAGGTADVVVIGDGAARTGLTGDYLSVSLAEPLPPRGARLAARLEWGAERLVARPLTPVS